MRFISEFSFNSILKQKEGRKRVERGNAVSYKINEFNVKRHEIKCNSFEVSQMKTTQIVSIYLNERV